MNQLRNFFMCCVIVLWPVWAWAALPTPDISPEVTEQGTGWLLSWEYNHTGDYDQNGEVNVADLTPIGMYFAATSAQADWAVCCVADGDANGEVNIADISPIGSSFSEALSEYIIEGDPDGGGSFTELARVAFTDALEPSGGGRLYFEYLHTGSAQVAFRVRGVGAGTVVPPPPPTGGFENLFFLHHSTGQGIINGGVRSAISDYNAAHSTSFEFWDHCYTWEAPPTWPGGLVGPDGTATGESYGAPTDATDPWDLYMLWTSAETEYANCRNLILANHEVIAFKSCFPASDIFSSDQLQEYKDYYQAMRAVFDTHPDRLFVVMSSPPLRPEETSSENAARARQFADWISGDGFLAGHPNVVCFDIFAALASDGSDGSANMLAAAFCEPGGDSHPNELANTTVAPLLAEFLCAAAQSYAALVADGGV